MHCGGYCCDMNAMMAIAKKHNIQVIEDCAHTLPGYYRPNKSSKWLHTGSFGITGCFSFYPNKCITTGEGGMITTNDQRIAERVSVMSLHGMNRDAWKRFTDQGSWYYEIVSPGFKYNFTDIAASIGIHQLQRADEFRFARKKIADKFSAEFANVPAIQTPYDDENTRIHAWHLYYIRLNLDQLRIDRGAFIDELKKRGIGCAVHWMPLHLHPYYREKYHLGEGIFPNAEKEWPRLISLPIFPSMTEAEQEYVIESVIDTVDKNLK